MNAAASDAVIAPAIPGVKDAEPPKPTALVESASDSDETVMEYDPNAHVPIVVIAVWVCAMIGLAIYSIFYYLPDLQKWAH